jgi:hypothetical protein
MTTTNPSMTSSTMSDQPQLTPARQSLLARLLLAIPLCVSLIAGTISSFTSNPHLYTDSAGYFAWSYAPLTQGTFNPSDTLRAWHPDAFPLRHINGQNLAIDKYPIGWSLATLPFAAAGRGIAAASHDPPDSPRTYAIMLHAVRLGVLFWITLGYLAAYRVLCALATPLSSAGAMFLVWLGTSAFAYTWRDLNMSHGIALTFIALTHWAAIKTRDAKCSWRFALLLGAATGMVIATRFLNIILIAPAYLLLFPARPRRIATIFPLATLTALPPLLLQLALWKHIYGSYVFNGYADESFHLNPTNLARVLISSRHGLFFWHPITLICLIGFAIAIRRSRDRLNQLFFLAITAALLLTILLYGAWTTWSLGWSYGARWAADPFLLWSLGLAVFADRYLPGGNAKRFALLTLLALISTTLITLQIAHLFPMDDYLVP